MQFEKTVGHWPRKYALLLLGNIEIRKWLFRVEQIKQKAAEAQPT